MTGKRLVLALLLAVVLAFPPVPPPALANPGSQTWYMTDFNSGLSGANYIMYRGSGNGATDTLLTVPKNGSRVWAADETSNIVCRMSGTWSVTLWADSAPPGSELTVDIGVLSADGTTFTSKGTSLIQTVSKDGGTLNFTVTTTSHNVNPGEYLALRVNAGSKDVDLDVYVLGGDSPCFAISPGTADDYPGTVFISFTVTDNGATGGINFGSLNPGTTDNAETEQGASGAVTLTVAAETNVDVNIQLKGDNFSGPDTFLLANADVQCDDENTLDEGSETDLSQVTLTTSYVTWYSVSAYAADSVECYHWMSVPAGQTGGSYASIFYYQAAQQ